MSRRRALVADEVRELASSSSKASPIVVIEDCRQPKAFQGELDAATAAIRPTPEEQRLHSAASALDAEIRGGAGYLNKAPSYPPFSKLAQLNKIKRTGRCTDRASNPGLLYAEAPGSRLYVNAMGYEVFELPKGTVLFKGTRYFYDSVGESPFIWVGNAPTAMMYASRYFGGCLVYRTKRTIRLFALNKKNCERLYKSTPWEPIDRSDSVAEADNRIPYAKETFEPLSPYTKAALELKFGVGISVREQANRVRMYNKLLDNEPLQVFRTRDIGRFTYCATPESTSIFGAGLNDRHVAGFFHARRDIIGIDGWFSAEGFSPYHCALGEELLLFPETGCLRVDPKHPLSWQKWLPLTYPDVRLPATPSADPFDLRPRYFAANHKFAVLSAVTRHESSALTRAVLKAAKTTKKKTAKKKTTKITKTTALRVLSWNVWGFQSPNYLTSLEVACDRCVALMEVRDPDVAILQNVPEDLSDRLITGMSSIGYRAIGSTAPEARWATPLPTGNSVAADDYIRLMCFLRKDDVLSVSGPCVVLPKDKEPKDKEPKDDAPNYVAMSIPLVAGKMKATLIACGVPSGEASLSKPATRSPLPIKEFVHALRTNQRALQVHVEDVLRAFPSARCMLGCFNRQNARIDHLGHILPKGSRVLPPPDVSTTIGAMGNSDQYVLLGPRSPEARCEALPFVQSMHYPVEVELHRIWDDKHITP